MTRSGESRSGILRRLAQGFGGAKSVEAPLLAYGKLPFYKDFIRVGLTGTEAQGLKGWLDRGMSRHWEGSEACRDHEIGAFGFVLSFGDSGRALAGFLWGSHDDGGLRRFPFTFFCVLPGGLGAGRPLASIDALDQVVREARVLREQVAAAQRVESFYERARDRSLTLTRRPEEEVLGHLRHALAGITVAAFAASLYGEQAGMQWPALLAYLRRHRVPGKGGTASPLAVRLPFSPLLPVTRQAQLWCALLGNQRRSLPNLLVPVDDPAPGLTLIERELRPDDVFGFHPGAADYEFIEDLRAFVPRASEPAAIPAAWQAGEQPLEGVLDGDLLGAPGAPAREGG